MKKNTILELKIENLNDYDFQIGHLVSTMYIARLSTYAILNDLSTKQLDYLYDEKSNSIGTILKHICALESSYQIKYLLNRQMNTAEEKEITPFLAGRLKENQVSGSDLTYYIELLQNTRTKTLELLASKRDRWLYEEVHTFGGKVIQNNYYLFFHLIEDEINHKSQIKWLKNRLPSEL